MTATVEAIDHQIEDYCRCHGIDPRRAETSWIARRHPQLVRLQVLRALIAKGSAIPTALLGDELPPLSSRERHRRASERLREWQQQQIR